MFCIYWLFTCDGTSVSVWIEHRSVVIDVLDSDHQVSLHVLPLRVIHVDLKVEHLLILVIRDPDVCGRVDPVGGVIRVEQVAALAAYRVVHPVPHWQIPVCGLQEHIR